MFFFVSYNRISVGNATASYLYISFVHEIINLSRVKNHVTVFLQLFQNDISIIMIQLKF